jgi:plasmid stabilization system protein ParE
MRLRVAQKAIQDLDGIYLYWARRAGLEVADRLLDALEEHSALLGDHPQFGRKCPEIAPGVLVFPAGEYLIYYRRKRKIIEILHVFHGARDQRKALPTE